MVQKKQWVQAVRPSTMLNPIIEPSFHGITTFRNLSIYRSCLKY